MLTALKMAFLTAMVFLTEGISVSADMLMPIWNAVTNVFSVGQIVAIISSLVAIAVAFVFLWWGVRKGFKSIMAAVTKGKLKI